MNPILLRRYPCFSPLLNPGARRIAYHLLEEAWGVAALLVLLLLPLGGNRPVLLAVLDAVGDPLLRLV